jgi:hypothetical protein
MGFAAASIDLETKLAKALDASRQNVQLDEKSLAKLTSVSMSYAKLKIDILAIPATTSQVVLFGDSPKARPLRCFRSLDMTANSTGRRNLRHGL